MNSLLSTSDVAAALGVTPRTIRNHMKRGLPHIMGKRGPVFDLALCRRWLGGAR